MLRTALVTAVVLLLPGVARADIAESVAAVRKAISDRLDAISGLVGPSKEELREAKKLGKADGSFESYAGSDDKGDLKALAKGAKLVLKSATADDAILEALSALVTSVVDHVGGLTEAVRQAGALVVGEKLVAKIDKLAGKAEELLAAAEREAGDDPGLALKLLLKAAVAFWKAEAKAAKLAARTDLEDFPFRGCDPIDNATISAVIDGASWSPDNLRRAEVAIRDGRLADVTFLFTDGSNDWGDIDLAIGFHYSFVGPGTYEVTGDDLVLDISLIKDQRTGFTGVSGTVTIESFSLADQTVSGSFDVFLTQDGGAPATATASGQFTIDCFRVTFRLY